MKKSTEMENLEKTPAAEEKPEAEAAEKKEKEFTHPKPCVYCGPSVRNVARQYTVYTEEVPDALKDFIKKHPAAKRLLVSTEKFAETRRRLETAGTAEALIYKKLKNEA